MTAESKVQHCTMQSDEAAEIKVCQNECVDIALIQLNTGAYFPAPPGPSRPSLFRTGGGCGVSTDKYSQNTPKTDWRRGEAGF